MRSTTLKNYVKNMFSRENEIGGIVPASQNEIYELRKQIKLAELRRETHRRGYQNQLSISLERLKEIVVLQQQLAEANANVAQLRAALKLANEDLAMWHEAEGQNKCDGCYTCEELKPIIDKALSTTPSQKVEWLKRLIEAANDMLQYIRSGRECYCGEASYAPGPISKKTVEQWDATVKNGS